jgi:hypothetical protein
VGQPRNVIVCAREDSWEKTIVPRLIAAGADLERVYQVKVERVTGLETDVLLPADNAEFADVVAELEAGLVVFDPLLSSLDADLNTHRASDVRKAIEPLADLAHDSGCAMLGLAHFAKAEGRDAASLISGSHAFKDVARSILVFARDGEASGVMSHVKTNLGKLPDHSWLYAMEAVELRLPDGLAEVPRFVLGQETPRHVEDLLDSGATRARSLAKDFLRKVLAGGARPSKDVEDEAKEHGIAERTLKRARFDLGITAVKSPVDGSWSISLPFTTGTLGSVGTVGTVGSDGTLRRSGADAFSSQPTGQRVPTVPVASRARAREDDLGYDWTAIGKIAERGG